MWLASSTGDGGLASARPPVSIEQIEDALEDDDPPEQNSTKYHQYVFIRNVSLPH